MAENSSKLKKSQNSLNSSNKNKKANKRKLSSPRGSKSRKNTSVTINEVNSSDEEKITSIKDVNVNVDNAPTKESSEDTQNVIDEILETILYNKQMMFFRSPEVQEILQYPLDEES